MGEITYVDGDWGLVIESQELLASRLLASEPWENEVLLF